MKVDEERRGEERRGRMNERTLAISFNFGFFFLFLFSSDYWC
jgi:hypothetical protein